MNKKWILTAAALLMLTGVTACGDDTAAENSQPTGAQDSEISGESTPEDSAAEDTPSDESASDETAGDSEFDGGEETPDAAQSGSIDFDYNFNGTVIVCGGEADPIIEALGAADSTFDAPSCAFTGTSYYYTYGGVQVVTYPDEFDQALNRIYEVDLTDATAATNEGISVGMTYEELVAVYGTPDSETAAYAMYKTDGKAVQFFFEGNEISTIIYTVQLN